MCKQYDDYAKLTKQAAAAKMRGEYDYSLELLRMRELPDSISLGTVLFVKGSHGTDTQHAGDHGK